MFFLARTDTQAVHVLADLLETIEVAADELMDKKLGGRDIMAIRALSEAEVEAQLADLRKFIGRIQELELGIVAKLGQARDNARMVSRGDWRLRPIMMLFTSGTQAFADRFESEPSRANLEFDGAGQIFPYLRSRGLVSPMTTNYDGSSELLVTDSFRLFGAMPLRDLLERCEATLNALDAHYDLFDLENDAAEEASVEVAPAQVVAMQPATAGIVAENVPAVVEVAASAPVLDAPPVAAEAAEVVVIAAGAPADTSLAAQQEAGIKGLTERLAEMKTGEPADEPAKAASAA